MKRFKFLSPLVPCALAVLLAWGGPCAYADEPPGGAFPPPVPGQPTAPPEDEAPAKSPATPERAWSPPAVTPGTTGSALPPPRVVRHRGAGLPPRSMPAAPAATPTSAATRLPPPKAPVIRDVPTWTPPLRPTPPSGLPTLPPAPAATPSAPARPANPAPPRLIDAVPSGTRVIGISKTHNVALANGDLALQLDVDYELRQQAGSDVYVAIWFVRKDTGKHVRAALASYADPGGFATLQTRSAKVPTALGRYAATLRIPYRTFPVAAGSDAYDVEARVQILRKERSGRVSALARGTTVFRVYGAAEDEPAAAPLAEPAPTPAAEPSAGPPPPEVTRSK